MHKNTDNIIIFLKIKEKTRTIYGKHLSVSVIM